MTYKQMVRIINTAGAGFTGVLMGEFLVRYPEYQADTANRIAFIQYIHQEYGVNLDYTYDTTKTKCYALMSIIESRKVPDALEYIVQCNEQRIGKEPIEAAMKLADAIILNKIRLP